MIIMSLIQQLKVILIRLSNELNKLDIDQTMFRRSIDKLSFLENSFLLPMYLAKSFKDIAEIVNKMNDILTTKDYRDKLKEIISHLSSKIDSIVETNISASRRIRLVLTFVIFILTTMGTLFSYHSSIYIGRDTLFIFLIALHGTSIALFLGIYLGLYTTILLLPTITLIPLVSLFLSLMMTGDITIILMILSELCCLAIITIFITNTIKSYRDLAIEILRLVSSIEIFINNINKTLRPSPIQSKEILEIYSKVYGDKANELIRYVEELSKLGT